MRRPWPTRGCSALGGGGDFCINGKSYRQRTEICGELEAVTMFYSRNYLAILLDLLLFRYLKVLPDKYNLAHYSCIISKCRKSQRTSVFHTRFGVIMAVFPNTLVVRRRYAASTGKYLPTFRLSIAPSSSGPVV